MEFNMWRLIVFILVCVIFLGFIVLNLDHKSDISFGFKTYKDIPVFLTAFSSFLLGMLFAVPFVLSFGKRRKKPSQAGSSDSSSSGGIKKLWGRKDKNIPEPDVNSKDGTPSIPAETQKKDGSYGID